MAESEAEKNERSLIALMLKHKDLVEDYIESSLNADHFDHDRRPIIHAICHSFDSGVLLTRKSFTDFINKHIEKKKQRANLETEFNAIVFRDPNRNDWPVLKEQILEAYLSRVTVEYIRNFDNERQEKGTFYALKNLAANVTDLSSDLSQDKNKIVYDDITCLGQKHFEKMLREYNDEEEEQEFISFGIDELDKTSEVGLAPGTLTLFCGDVGGFKCLAEGSVVDTYELGRCKIEDIYNTINHMNVNTSQYDHQTYRLIKQPILDAVYQGQKQCVRIKTQLGHHIDCSYDHRNLFFSGYKPAKDVRVGDYIAISRKSLEGNVNVNDSIAKWLGFMLAEGGTSSSSYRFTNNDPQIVKSMYKCVKNISGNMTPVVSNGKRIKGQYRVTGCKDKGKYYGLDKRLAIEKDIPNEVFSWNNHSVSNLLSAMYSGDGIFSFESSLNKTYKSGCHKRKYEIVYSTSSKKLAHDVRDLLLKFGIIASISKYNSYNRSDYSGSVKNLSYRVEIRDINQIIKFVEQIGFIGEKQRLAKFHINLNYLQNEIKSNLNNDVIPERVWYLIDQKLKDQNKTFTGCRRFYRSNVHRKWKRVSRNTLRKIAHYLNDDPDLFAIANSDVYWDKVVSIEDVGLKDTYDLAMPDSHNFIANNIVTHNSTQMLNIASNVWWHEKKNVLFVPLEMPEEMIYKKWLSRQTMVPFDYINSPKSLTEEQLEKLRKFEYETAPNHEALFFLMDSYEERTKVSVIKKMIERNLDIFKPRLVVIDYIANLQPEQRMNDRNDLEIGAMLKDLRHMGRPGVLHDEGFAIMSGAQLGREALKRVRRSSQDKTAFYSEDIRGSHEYSADSDMMYAQIPDPQQPDEQLQLHVIKSRYGKKTFPDGQRKALLDVQPELSLIKSNADFYEGDDKSFILSKAFDNQEDESDFPTEDDSTSQKSSGSVEKYSDDDVDLDDILSEKSGSDESSQLDEIDDVLG